MKQILVISCCLANVFCMCLYTSVQAQSYTWGNVAIGGGGYVNGIVTSKKDPNVVYCRTDVGGGYRWDYSNSKWMPLLDWVDPAQSSYMGVESIAVDPNNSANVYMLVGTSYLNGGISAIVKSSDYGATFTTIDVTSQFRAHGNGSGRGNGEKLQVDPNNGNILWCGTRQNGLFKSIDGGYSWNKNTALPVATTKVYYGGIGTGIGFVVLDSSSGTLGNATPKIYVGVATVDSTYNFYYSNNGGATFNPAPLAGGPNPRRVMPARASLASDGNMYITYDSMPGPGDEVANSGAVWKYNTNTSTWTNITPAVGLAYGGVTVDPKNPLRILVSTVNTYKIQYGSTFGDRFYLSNDGGATWRNLMTNNIVMDNNGIPWINGQSIHWAGSIEFNPFNSNQAWVGSGNGIFFCPDLNATTNTWKFMAQGIEETVPTEMVSIPDGPVFSVILDYDGFKHTSITQYPTGRHSPTTGSTNSITYAALNTNRLVRVGGNMYYTNNQGATWTKTSSMGGGGTNGRAALSANGNIILHCPTGNNSSNYTYRSDDNGTTWGICTGVNFNSAAPTADPVNSNKFYIYNTSTGIMMVSNDGGASFSNGGTVGTGGSKLIRTAPGYEGHLWVAMNNGGLKRSINSGANFTTVSGGTTGLTFCAAVGLGKAVDASSYYTLYIWGTVNGVLGVHRSTNQGLSWQRVNDDYHQYGGLGNGNFVMGDMNVFGRYYMSTLGRGIAYGDDLAILPVVLNSFSGVLNQEKLAVLQWATTSEINSSYFDIERGTNGIDFIKIGSTPSLAAGVNSTSNVLNYTFTDNKVANAMVYYRLKLVDKDGRYTYSNILKLNNASGISNGIQVYPNPATQGNINIKIQLAAPKNIQVRIVDMFGKVVYTNAAINLPAGSNLLPVCAPGFGKGAYLVEVYEKNRQTIIGTTKVIMQ